MTEIRNIGTTKEQPVIVDLYCCAGGASMGYYRAGFKVYGVDITVQRHYPFSFFNSDVIQFLGGLLSGKVFTFDDGDSLSLKNISAFHASPPCQKHSVMTKGRWQDRDHPELIEPTRELLIATGLPYVIENVPGAKEYLRDPITLCGTMFGLGTKAGNQLLRHRLFEVPGMMIITPSCQHNKASAIGVYGGGQHPKRRRPATSLYRIYRTAFD